MLKSPLITLTTDFGLTDPFAGLMKGVILGINPDIDVVDISHNITRHDITEAARVIASSYAYFPRGTIHVAVVDPGVGSRRRPIMVVTDDYYFVGPDNGIFSSIYDDPRLGHVRVIHVSSSDYFLPRRGATFHGRDIFAPVAAWLSRGEDPEKFGNKIDDYRTIHLNKPVVSDKTITGEIVYADNFGNAISNISADDLAQLFYPVSAHKFSVLYRGSGIPLVNYYSEEAGPSLSAVINSFGHVELFVYQKNAVDEYNIQVGDAIEVRLV